MPNLTHVAAPTGMSAKYQGAIISDNGGFT